MNEPVSDSNPNPKDPPQLRKVADGVANTKTGKSSAIMAAGTLVSRVLGFVRQWLRISCPTHCITCWQAGF